VIPIGAQLHRLREEKEISLHTIERKTGLQRRFIQLVEKGLISPSVESLERFAEVLGIQVWELVYTGERWKPPQYLTELHELAQATGKDGQVARFFLKLRPFLARIPKRKRAKFLAFAKELARAKRSAKHFPRRPSSD
jgi:transcriptional regulator with XRE-family HTH domain